LTRVAVVAVNLDNFLLMQDGDMVIRIFKIQTFFVFLLLIIPFLCHAFDQWPDTGQTTSYTDTFGEDSDYSINPQSYTKLGSGGEKLPDTATFEDGWIMTKDNVTGLIWEVKTDDGTLHDMVNVYSWSDTIDFITAVNNEHFGGFSDWRMPTIKELLSIVNCDQSYPSIDIFFFPKTISYHYWSNNTKVSATSSAWYASFSYGYSGSDRAKTYRFYVRAVRGGL